MRMIHTNRSICVTLLVAITVTAKADESPAKPHVLPARVTFNAHIRPIMSNTCFQCHGPDDADNDSGFRIDSFEAATGLLPSDDDLVGIKPNDPDASEVYRRITVTDDGESMPPSDFRHQLTDFDKALFRRWIEQGAEYEQHWSYSPIVRPKVPTGQADRQWTANPIDAFIRSRLRQEGLAPSDSADKATLLRRLSLDLIGLPPTEAELAAFLTDESENALEKQIDRLLASEHFGERMASFWFDLVRFADTVGYHGDQNQRIFPYRDYVIAAFNENKPFDEFTCEQIAGDLLPEPTPEQLTATGFLRLNMLTREGGAQPGEYLAKYKADRVRTIGTAWLGATLGCCECHNHKYDPFTAKDFYSLGAFFDDLKQWGVYSNYKYTPNNDLKGFNNDYPFPPEQRVDSPSLRQEILFLQSERNAAIRQQIGPPIDNKDKVASWASSIREFLKVYPDGWAPMKVAERVVHDDRISIKLTTPKAMTVNSFRLEALPDETSGFVGRGDNGGFQVSVTARLEAKESNSEQATELQIAWGEADRRKPKSYSSGKEPLVLDEVWDSGPSRFQLPADENKLPHTAVYHFAVPFELHEECQLVVQLKSSDIGRVRISATPLGHAIAGWDAASESLRKAIVADNEAETLLAEFHLSTVPFADQCKPAKYYRDQLLKARSGMAFTLIAQSVAPNELPVSRVLRRGNWQDESGELAAPAVPHFLPQPTIQTERRLTRLDLANWLTSPENPLTPRHFVNHTWKQFFGTGLSSKLDDLGSQGEWPSHPELLDWLAAEFVDSRWDVKHLVRQIVSSRTYQQTAAVRTDLSEVDPYNRLLAEQSARRLEAEAIRDNALAIAGLLNLNYIGGPSVFPYQPDGHYRNLQFPNRKYSESQDARQYRRSVYMHWQRTFLHPMLVNFDAPARDECTADRPLSNSPQQALTLLNDPTFAEASRVMAEGLIDEMPKGTFEDRVKVAFKRAVARTPSGLEIDSLRDLFDSQLAYYRDHPDAAKAFMNVGNSENLIPAENAATVAAMGQVCRVILNLHETITRY
ncbi:Planctomycete cytochrome C [Planctomycetes bacterium CA13]|uniref:Planctomycete cytochrome C n=1 Tax=Novipirellula herctigrandis TaxID=2527986 RepID=A0A5C5ZBW5_9BACT|nr:Planctomycete cytochrome C [Planctomycetes bacterium CA13]